MNHLKFFLLLLFPTLLLGCAVSEKTTGADVPYPPAIKFIDTDYLEATRGYKGEVLDAKIIDIESSGDSQAIEINVPIDPDQVDQVVVISPSGKKLQQQKDAEVIRDYENNNVGITIFLPKQKNWSFKLRLVDQPGEE